MKEKKQLPTIRELHSDVTRFEKQDQLNWLCNQEPKKEWIKKHPQLDNWFYIPIGIIDTLMQRIFKSVRTEIKEVKQILNGVNVIVRVHYKNPTTGEWEYQDGTGTQELMTEKGSGVLKPDFSNIKRGAVTIATPIAETFAIKDACEKIGKLFGRDLNRKDVLEYVPEMSITDKAENKEQKRILEHIESLFSPDDLILFAAANPEYKDICSERIYNLKRNTHGK